MIVEHIGRTRTPDETVAAYAAGYEAASLSLDALGPRGRKQLRGPWQPASLVGPIGSAVATGLLRGSSDDVMSDGLIIAASFAAGLQANFGSNLKPLQLGRASALGREAILLAEAGFRPEPELLERDNGFAAAFGQQPDWISAPRWAGEEPVLLSGAGGETVGQGPWIKLFPACGGTNPVATAALQIVDEVGLTADQIAAVVVVENRDRSRGALFRVEPQSPEEARFSLRFVVAAAFILRRLDPAAFTEEAFHQVTNHRLWPLIRVEIRPGEDEASETTVRVTSTGGETHERHVLGRGRVADDDEVTSKFRSCAKPTVGAAVAESVVKLMRDSSGPNLSGALASIWQ
jgi:2-methylcitrate dehydratase PrpD